MYDVSGVHRPRSLSIVRHREHCKYSERVQEFCAGRGDRFAQAVVALMFGDPALLARSKRQPVP